jgi:DNA-binding response OmpR family regulator
MAMAMSNPASVIQAPRVLVVDDQADERQFMTESLSAQGFPCITAATVAEATEILRSQPVALMVLDWGLDRSGAEVLQAARTFHPHMPVVVVSGRSYDVRTDALVGQADAFLLKPFSATVLQCQVRQLLQRVNEAPKAWLPQRAEEIRPVQAVKAAYVLHVLRLLDHNISLAAERLGIHRQTVGALLRRTSDTQTPDALDGSR